MIRKFLKKYKLRFKYPGISINPGVLFINNGKFSYGKNCIIDKESTVVITGSLSLGDDVIILKDTDIDAHNIEIGSKVSVQKHSFIFGDVKIGSYCLFAPNIFISSGVHEFKRIPALNIRDQDALDKGSSANGAIVIGEDCWLGINVVVLPGVKIGKGCIVGANSVVNKDIPPYSIAVGIPAKVVSERLKFSPPKKIMGIVDHIPYLYSGFNTAQNPGFQDGISLLSENVEIVLDVNNSKEVKISLKNSTYCIVNSKKYNTHNNTLTFPVEEYSSQIAIAFDKNEFSQIRIEEIWTE